MSTSNNRKRQINDIKMAERACLDIHVVADTDGSGAIGGWGEWKTLERCLLGPGQPTALEPSRYLVKMLRSVGSVAAAVRAPALEGGSGWEASARRAG